MHRAPASRFIVFTAIAVAGCIGDLVSKFLVFRWLGPPPSATYWIIPNVFGFQTSLNQGALFGLGQGFVLVFAVLSVLALVGVLAWVFFGGAARDWMLTIALGCITAGILGNLHDRLGVVIDGQRVHAVRDFILVLIFGWHWPNFNIADSLLVTGACLLVWHAFRQEKLETPG